MGLFNRKGVAVPFCRGRPPLAEESSVSAALAKALAFRPRAASRYVTVLSTDSAQQKIKRGQVQTLAKARRCSVLSKHTNSPLGDGGEGRSTFVSRGGGRKKNALEVGNG